MEKIARAREPSEKNPPLLKERMKRVGSYILGLYEECTFIGRPCLVDRVSEWQYKLVTAREGVGRLAKHVNRQCCC